jgi:SAM-dependent methyltransferase
MSPHENAYGVRKRFEFVAEIIRQRQPAEVLDVGCGSGMMLTRPLAEAFPRSRFVGVDSDPGSIRFANSAAAPANLEFLLPEALAPDRQFDLVVASEVIEHVESPVEFLQLLAGRLKADGRLLLTLPNGYGPFEVATLMETALARSGILPLLLRLRRSRADAAPRAADTVDTLAFSPHINFFSFRVIREVIRGAGLRELAYRPRTWLCGFGFDSLLRTAALLRWNADIAERLPPWTVSDWMFVLDAGGMPGPYRYRRNWYARLRRRWNEHRPGQA